MPIIQGVNNRESGAKLDAGFGVTLRLGNTGTATAEKREDQNSNVTEKDSVAHSCGFVRARAFLTNSENYAEN